MPLAEKDKKANDVFDDVNEEKVLFEWTAAERSFQQRDRDFWITAIAILVLVSVILIFIKEFFLVVALASVLFLYYVLSTVPPQNIKNKLTTRGVYFGELHYSWANLTRFWFKNNLSSLLLNFETALKFPRQVSMVVIPRDQQVVKEIIIKRIPLLEAPPSFIDKLTKWFGDRLPLENRQK